MTPAQLAMWVHMRLQSGMAAVIGYCSLAIWQECIDTMHSAGVPEPLWQVAAYPGIGAVVYAGAVGHQFSDSAGGRNVDQSVWVTNLAQLLGSGPAPAPGPPPYPVAAVYEEESA